MNMLTVETALMVLGIVLAVLQIIHVLMSIYKHVDDKDR